MPDLEWLDAELLRIFLGKSDRIGTENAADALLRLAHAQGLRGATVLEGSTGFGANSVIHRPAFLMVSRDAPVVIEIVDTAEHIEAFLPILLRELRGGLVTRERLNVLARPGAAP